MTQKALMELAVAVLFTIGILQWASESSSDGSTAFVMAAIFTIGACITHVIRCDATNSARPRSFRPRNPV